MDMSRHEVVRELSSGIFVDNLTLTKHHRLFHAVHFPLDKITSQVIT